MTGFGTMRAPFAWGAHDDAPAVDTARGRIAALGGLDARAELEVWLKPASGAGGPIMSFAAWLAVWALQRPLQLQGALAGYDIPGCDVLAIVREVEADAGPATVSAGIVLADGDDPWPLGGRVVVSFAWADYEPITVVRAPRLEPEGWPAPVGVHPSPDAWKKFDEGLDAVAWARSLDAVAILTAWGPGRFDVGATPNRDAARVVREGCCSKNELARALAEATGAPARAEAVDHVDTPRDLTPRHKTATAREWKVGEKAKHGRRVGTIRRLFHAGGVARALMFFEGGEDGAYEQNVDLVILREPDAPDPKASEASDMGREMEDTMLELEDEAERVHGGAPRDYGDKDPGSDDMPDVGPATPADGDGHRGRIVPRATVSCALCRDMTREVLMSEVVDLFKAGCPECKADTTALAVFQHENGSTITLTAMLIAAGVPPVPPNAPKAEPKRRPSKKKEPTS